MVLRTLGGEAVPQLPGWWGVTNHWTELAWLDWTGLDWTGLTSCNWP